MPNQSSVHTLQAFVAGGVRMPRPARLLAVAWLLCACLSASAQTGIYLLGEVHDNPQAHAQRFAFVEKLLAKGFKPVIAMEQFDRDKQATLDRAMATCTDADCVIEQAGGKGWTWNFYKPVIETALKRRLTIVAANLSTVDAMKIAREGLGAALSPETLRDFRLDQPLDKALFDKQKQAIDEGHCHMLPATAFKGMVNAQVARDVWMARTVRDNAAHGLILLAGNGHVRKDIGVYRWLGSAERARTQAFAYTEDEGDVQDLAVFDRIHRVEPFERDDPCEAFTRKTQVQT